MKISTFHHDMNNVGEIPWGSGNRHVVGAKARTACQQVALAEIQEMVLRCTYLRKRSHCSGRAKKSADGSMPSLPWQNHQNGLLGVADREGPSSNSPFPLRTEECSHHLPVLIMR